MGSEQNFCLAFHPRKLQGISIIFVVLCHTILAKIERFWKSFKHVSNFNQMFDEGATSSITKQALPDSKYQRKRRPMWVKGCT